MSDPEYRDLAADLRRWAAAPWWRRWWVRWRLRLRLREDLLVLLAAQEDLRNDWCACREQAAQLHDGINELVSRFQGLTGMVKVLVVPEQQDRFVATMHDAIDAANKATGGIGYAKPKASTATTPLVCGQCGKTSSEPGLRFFQGIDSVTCFVCLGENVEAPKT